MELQREQFSQVLCFLQGDILATQSLSDMKNVHFCCLKSTGFMVKLQSCMMLFRPYKWCLAYGT